MTKYELQEGALERHGVLREVCRLLEPYWVNDQPILGTTVLTGFIDSVAVMDLIMELEDHYDISIPMNVTAEIETLDQLVDTVLHLHEIRRKEKTI